MAVQVRRQEQTLGPQQGHHSVTMRPFCPYYPSWTTQVTKAEVLISSSESAPVCLKRSGLDRAGMASQRQKTAIDLSGQ